MIGTAAREAWGDLDAKLHPFVARRVRSPVDVDDVVQEVFLRIHRGLGALRSLGLSGRPEPIADHQRAAIRHRVVDAEPLVEARAPAPDVEDDDEQLLATYVAPIIAMIRSPYREALTLLALRLDAASERSIAPAA